MEYVGKTVKKQFQGYGVFSGTVKSYDPLSGFFEVVYEDGDSEELELSDIALLLEEGKVVEATTQTELIETKSRPGRKPKKRRRVQLTGEIRGDSGNVDNLSKDGVDHEGFTITQEKKLRDDPNDGLEPNLGLSSIPGLDLNDGLSFKDTFISDVNFEGSVKMRDCIDLNLNANAEFDENPKGVDSNVEIQKRECSFDLNLGFDDESNGTEGVHGRQLVEKTGFQRVEETRKAHEEGGRANGSLKGIFFENVKGNSGEEIRGTASFGCVSACYVQDSRSIDVQMEGGFSDAGTPINNEYTPVNNEYRDSLGSSYRRRTSGTKRRKHSENLKVARGSPTPAAQSHVLISSTPCAVIDMTSSPVISAVFDGKPDISVCEGTEELSGPPLNLPLPPSSQNLNLDGISVLDLFSIYACLRSFSTLLFLSPFELEDFVAALKCQSPSSLFDSIHVSILQTLRKHLEHLSNEGSQSATDCLRCLNWGLLDLVTWPIFMVEYLLFQGSGVKPDFDLSRMKLFDSDYYRQPVSVKVEILRCLCDDVIEVEAIRSEINRRSLAALPDKDFERSANIEMCKKRTVMDVSGGSCLTEEVLDEPTDGNSDECCLCKMDGSLICCDGCPAAYHSRCVGVSNDLLPEGDWYCPECTIDKHKPGIKPQKSLRGAELLGHDPQGRLYFSSCGYLLVSDACDSEYTFSYYHRDDLNVVIDMLKSSDIRYSGILNLISKHWDIPTYFRSANNNLVSQYPDVCSNLLMKGHIPVISTPSQPLEPSETCAVEDETVDQRRAEENSNVVEDFSHHGHMVAKSVDLLDSVTTNHFIKMDNPLTSSDGSAEIVQASTCIDNCIKHDSESLNKPTGLLNQSEIPRKLAPVGDPLICSTTEIKQDENLECAFAGYHVSAIKTSKGNFSEVDCGPVYVNYYSFGQTAASVGEELMPKSFDKINQEPIRSVEEIISTQLKAISKKATMFFWPNIQNLNMKARKEKCGWCLPCRVPDDYRDCLFKINDAGLVREGFRSVVLDIQSKMNGKQHLIDVICHILCIEERLRGLLSGPWLNPHHSVHWRRGVLKASDIASVKHPLLSLESNLRRLALSVEWLKHVDSVVTMGSASHVVTSSTCVSSKHGISRKRGKCADVESNPSSDAATGLSMFWWRGGRLSRHVFSWKILPHSLARKAARQAGCTKVPGIQYPDNSEFAKRSKYIAWRAAVETSTSVDQLALLVRELDSYVKWDAIENTRPQSMMDKDSKKSVRSFKKVIIRRRCVKGTVAKYLLDFGNRKVIPDVVVRRGSITEDSAGGRKTYWLEEPHVPLHLIKAFEERRIVRKASKMNSGKLPEGGRVEKKPSKNRGFSYLFSRAEKMENYQCGHCKRDVLIREAVICQYCEDFFHKRHVKKSPGAITAECTYTCHRCRDGKYVVGTKRVKVQLQKSKNATEESGKVQLQKSKKVVTESRPIRSQNSINKKSIRDSRLVRSKTSKSETSTPDSLQSKTCKTAKTGRQLVRSQNNPKVAVDVPPRRSARKVKYKSMQTIKFGACKKGKQIKSKNWTSKRAKKGTCWQKKRTQIYHAYWLNGLQLSKKPNDERVMHFRSTKLFVSDDLTDGPDRPKCRLCSEGGHTSMFNYIGCEICGDWYHGDAFGLDGQKIGNVIGFRCHECRKRTPPVCPHLQDMRDDETQSGQAKDNRGVVRSPILKVYVKQKRSHSDRDSQVTVPDPHNQSTALEPNLEAENGDSPIGKRRKTDAIQNYNETDLKPEVQIETEPLSCKIAENVDLKE